MQITDLHIAIIHGVFMSISETICRDFQVLMQDVQTFFKEECKNRYNFLKEKELLNIEAIKTAFAATILSLPTGLVCGTTVGLITFVVTAVYAGTARRLDFDTTHEFEYELQKIQNFKSKIDQGKKLALRVLSYALISFGCIILDIKFAIKEHRQDFNKVDRRLQNYMIAKTAIVASVIGLTTGLCCGAAIGLITFTVTAIYVKGAIVKRVGFLSNNEEAVIERGKELGVLAMPQQVRPKHLTQDQLKELQRVDYLMHVLGKKRFEIFRNQIYFAMSL